MRGHAIIPRVPGSISSKWYPVRRNPTSFEAGVDRTSSTSGTYARMTGVLIVNEPFVLTSIKSSFVTAQTYVISFVNSTGASPSTVYTLNSAFTATGGHTEDTIPIGNSIVLMSNFYRISFYCSTPVAWERSNTGGDRIEYSNYLITYGIWFNGTINAGNLPPIKIIGNFLEYHNIKNYDPFPII